MCNGYPIALCFPKIRNELFNISQKMKNLQNYCVRILFTIGNRNITEHAQRMQQPLLPSFHPVIQILLTMKFMVVILSLTGNLGDVR